jgi:hypothetical protein
MTDQRPPGAGLVLTAALLAVAAGTVAVIVAVLLAVDVL